MAQLDVRLRLLAFFVFNPSPCCPFHGGYGCGDAGSVEECSAMASCQNEKSLILKGFTLQRLLPHPPPAFHVAWATNMNLAVARLLTLGSVCLSFPLATIAVFVFQFDRTSTADAVAVVYSFGIFLGCTTSLWPLQSLRSWSLNRRIDSMAFVFMIMSYITHLTWELVWLVAHRSIAESRDEAWAYTWWAYIDGGDDRYAHPTPTLFMMEGLSVVNGLVGVAGLFLLHRSTYSDKRGVMLCMATAVVHLYSTSMYYGGEILAGLPSVDTSSFFATYVKFGLANAPWVVFPWAVLHWGARQLLPASIEAKGN